MQKASSTTRRGFSAVEMLLAVALLAVIATAFVGAYTYGESATVSGGTRARATLLAEEGLEAVRNIRDVGFYNLTPGTYGLVLSGGQWTLSGLSDAVGEFTRSISIASIDSSHDTASCTVSWQQSPTYTDSITLATEFTNWQLASCNDAAIQSGYNAGSCSSACTSGQVQVSLGDQFCTSGKNNTCCASSGVTPPPATTCNAYAIQQGYTSGSCERNTRTCTRNGGTYLSGGDQYCTSGNTNTCCGF